MSVNIFKYRTPVSTKGVPRQVFTTSVASATSTVDVLAASSTMQIEISNAATVTLSGRLNSSLSFVQFYSATANSIVNIDAGYSEIQIVVTGNTGDVAVWATS